MLLYGTLIEQMDMEESGRDKSGLGRWVYMTFVGEGGLVTKAVYAVTIHVTIRMQLLARHINSIVGTSSIKNTTTPALERGLN
jgi:hypothetical protein